MPSPRAVLHDIASKKLDHTYPYRSVGIDGKLIGGSGDQAPAAVCVEQEPVDEIALVLADEAEQETQLAVEPDVPVSDVWAAIQDLVSDSQESFDVPQKDDFLQLDQLIEELGAPQKPVTQKQDVLEPVLEETCASNLGDLSPQILSVDDEKPFAKKVPPKKVQDKKRATKKVPPKKAQ